jgi:deoxyhypusine synthase
MQQRPASDNPVPRTPRQLADGWCHNLQPLEPFDVFNVNTCAEMLARLKRTAFGARNLGEAADVLYEMVADPKCLVVGTFSGAMTIAKMGLLLADMIDQGLLGAVVSTGALLCHGLVEQIGSTHFRHDPSWSDEELYKAGYDRVYDTLELERNLYRTEKVVVGALKSFGPDRPFGSWEFNRCMGEQLNAEEAGRGILQSAAARGVPIYVPALIDSELGLDLFTYNYVGEKLGTNSPARFDPLRDIADFYERVAAAERLGIFTIGGGVPRNWVQQIGPLGEIIYNRTEGKLGGLIRFRYGVRICPEPAYWGGLSGCTYSEGVSWGKFIPPKEGGRYAEVLCDATIAWPILVRGVLERLGRV